MKAPRSELRTVTPQMADEWLNHSNYDRQRKRAEWHVRRLAREIERGRFVAGTQIHFGVLDGNLKLLNGQHTLAAIVRSGIPTPLQILQTPVRDEKELGELYGRHDRHRSRTSSDAFYGMGLAQDIGLSDKETNAFAPALKYVLNDFRRAIVTDGKEFATSLDCLAEHMTLWSAYAREYFGYVREAGPGLKGPFRRAPAVAIALVTIKHQPAKAIDFWAVAAADDGLHKDDPRKALVNWLLSHSSQVGDPITYMRNIASAWNKFYQNGTLQFLRPGELGKMGITIRGTPYKAVRRVGSQVDDDDAESVKPAQGVLGGEAHL